MSNVNNVNNFFVSKVYRGISCTTALPITFTIVANRMFDELDFNFYSKILANVCLAPFIIAGSAYSLALGLAVAAVAALTHAIALAVAGVMDLFTAPDAPDDGERNESIIPGSL